MLRIFSIAAAAILVAGIVMNWADVKRYVKIESM